MIDDCPIALDERAERRLRKISDETGRSLYDLVASAAEEAALNYFRGRPDDPGYPPKR